MKNNRRIIILESWYLADVSPLQNVPCTGTLVRSDVQTQRMISYAISYCPGE